ncbi:MAG: bifunctional N-acetylglucosamine-1-phosphate uridyltransferase/glucosamine-1-phosphate acetyltransferase [Candidatus Omnitrophica bacterium]|nr:bifunctional N-acetylglucosamine-1-phosphate uridyltransferase/glucosamine-1-phosphate acetyltransferase [Candidatus Omnitrophota bacterium]
MSKAGISAIILAAGKSTRIKQKTPKIILDLGGRPLIFHLLAQLDVVRAISEIIVVLGHQKEIIEPVIRKAFPKIKFAYQKKLNGTAKAVEAGLAKTKGSDVLVMCGDTPLMTKATLIHFLKTYRRTKSCALVATSSLPYENSLGRIFRDRQGKIARIIEKRDLKQRIDEVNSGMYCFSKKHLIGGLKKIRMNPHKKEYYVTDIIEIFNQNRYKTESVFIDDWTQIMGVNDLGDLAFAYKSLNKRLLEKAMGVGVRIIDPDTTYVHCGVKIGADTIIYPFTFIENDVIIGSNCRIGPFARVRKGSIIKDDTSVGNFTEINRSVLGKHVRAKHFSYIGDAYIGQGSNIGAGAVFANYDGRNKNKTVVGKNVFIGSDTVIVAPLAIGDNARTGAGCVVTKNVKKNTTVVGVPARTFSKKKG